MPDELYPSLVKGDDEADRRVVQVGLGAAAAGVQGGPGGGGGGAVW